MLYLSKINILCRIWKISRNIRENSNTKKIKSCLYKKIGQKFVQKT